MCVNQKISVFVTLKSKGISYILFNSWNKSFVKLRFLKSFLNAYLCNTCLDWLKL